MEKTYPRRDWLAKTAVRPCTEEDLRQKAGDLNSDVSLPGLPDGGQVRSYECSPYDLVSGPTYPRWDSEPSRERYLFLEDSGRRARFYDILVWPFARQQILHKREANEDPPTAIAWVCPRCLRREVALGSESILSLARWPGSESVTVFEFDREGPGSTGSNGVCVCPAEGAGPGADVKTLRRMAAADGVYLKFCRRMEIIILDVVRLLEWSDRDQRYRKFITERFGGPGRFDVWVQKMYVFSATVMARAQRFKKGEDVSLMRFLEEVVKHPTVFTRARLEAQWTGHFDEHTGYYDKVFGSGRDALHSPAVEADIQLLRDRTEIVATAASRLLAHRDERGLEESVTLESLDDAIDCIRILTDKYRRLYPQMPSVEDRLEPGWVIERDLEQRWPPKLEGARLPWGDASE
ncbi:MAG: hypothetical protein O7H41_20835 [Planctomycetota bacterium]|nr:hypothetical protein [Planctomycetota bacterium]